MIELIIIMITLIIIIYILYRGLFSSRDYKILIVIPALLGVIVFELYNHSVIWFDYLSFIWYLSILITLLRRG